MTDCTNIPKRVQRIKWTQTDGAEREKARICEYDLGVDDLEAVGHEALRVAAEWRQEIAERVLAPPTHKVFAFTGLYSNSEAKIASWVEHPWALTRVGNGTAVVFLVKGQGSPGSYQAWTVAAKEDANGTLRWKRRFETATTVNRGDLVHVFPAALPWSPSQGDLEYSRANAQRGAA